VIRLLQLAKKVLYEKQQCRFYQYDAGQGTGASNAAVAVYESYAEIPPQFRKAAVPSRYLNVMYYRLNRGAARLLCYSEDGHNLHAFGWIQSWAPFRRKFGMLAKDGVMLGPYWTAPEHRGGGVYGKLLQHSLSLCPRTKPILIYTSADNVSSQRGIVKAGFEPLGEWMIAVWLRRWVFARRLDV
jgi:hypothetical protein